VASAILCCGDSGRWVRWRTDREPLGAYLADSPTQGSTMKTNDVGLALKDANKK